MLLAEDDPQLRSALQRTLERRNFEVTATADGGEALRALNASAVDLLVLDLKMAPVDGWTVVDHLRQVPSSPPTIVLSGFVDVRSAVGLIKAGVVDVIEKPLVVDELTARIDTALSRRRPREGAERFGLERLVGESAAIEQIRRQLAGLARFPDLPVLLRGEPGTEKALIARALHELCCPVQPFVSVDCAALTDRTFDPVLFGTHNHGHYEPGLFESAARGTVYFESIGELTPSLQKRLLRLLETRDFRAGGHTGALRRIEARLVSSMVPAVPSRALEPELLALLSTFTITIPSLRDRGGDIGVLAMHYLKSFASRYPGTPAQFNPDALHRLGELPWPGNLRELRATVEQAAVSCRATAVQTADILAARLERGATAPAIEPSPVDATALSGERPVSSLRDLEQQLIVDTYSRQGKNLARTARALGMARSTLRDRLKRYGAV